MSTASQLSKKSAPELLDCIIAMGSGGIAESIRDEEFLQHFYPLPEHARALDPHVLLVIGDRGAGKTNLFRAIQTTAGLQAIISLSSGRPIPPPDQCDWLVGFNSEGADHPSEMLFQGYAKGKEPIALQHAWLGLLIKRLVAQEKIAGSCLPEPLLNAVIATSHDLAAIAKCTSSHLVELFSVLDAFDAQLRADNRWLFMTYDALDRVSSGDWDVMKLVIRGLVQFWASNSRRWTRLRPKIFLRRDLFERVALYGPDVSKIAAQRVELVWTPRHLYKMILKRMMNQDKKLRHYLDQLQLPGNDDSNLGWCPGDVSDDQLKKFAELLCGEFMGAGPNKGRTYSWIPNHLQDGNGHILPRSFVRLFESAAQVEKEAQRAEWPHLIHHTSLRAAVDDVSKNRVQEIAEEFPWLKTVQSTLSQLNATLPFERTKLERLLNINWDGLADRPPETSGRDLLKLLMELGIFYSKADRKTDTRIDVRDLYLKGFGFKRKGGVAHLH